MEIGAVDDPMEVECALSIESLPVEILLRIFSFLSEELMEAGEVCRRWNMLAARELYDRGMNSMEVMHDNFSAIKEFTMAIMLQPTAVMPRFKRGVAYYKESEEDEALRDIRRALQLGPTGADYHIIQSMRCQIELKFEEAVLEATKALEIDPMNGSAYYLRGYNRFDLQNYKGSIEDLTHCLSLPYPYKSKVYNCRGWCYKIIGETDKALSDFTISSRLNVRYTKPYVNKAIVMSSCKNKVDAIEEEEYLSKFLGNTQERNLGAIYYTRAAIRQQWEKYAEAIQDYKLSIKNNYHSLHKAFVSVGWCYEKLGQYEKAIREYNRALRIKPNYSIAMEHRAGAKCRIDGKAAEEDCRLAIEINPKNLSFSYRYLAAVIADNNDYPAAITTLTEGLRVNPLDTDMLVNRAGYYTCQGKFDVAVTDYDMCLKHRPDTYEAWKNRANAKFASSDVEGAIHDYENTLFFEPDDWNVYNNCALAKLAIGDFEGAVKDIQKALDFKGSDENTELLRNNLRLVKYIQEKRELPKGIFDPQFITDPVFEKDIEKKMKDVTYRRLCNALSRTSSFKKLFHLKGKRSS